MVSRDLVVTLLKKERGDVEERGDEERCDQRGEVALQFYIFSKNWDFPLNELNCSVEPKLS